jgi:2-oxoglutarate dehydrogenase E2 component (dihydrolipoamide succinyltransferase)
MPVEIKVPSVGESITEGTLARWLKKDGAAVAADEPLFELETDKASTEIAAPAAGVLRIAVAEGEKVAVGAVVGRIEEAPAGKAAASAASPNGPSARPAPPAPEPRTTPPPRTEPAPLSPAARRLAEEAGVNPGEVTGTGRGGRVIKEDVQAKISQPAPESSVRVAGAESSKPRDSTTRGFEDSAPPTQTTEPAGKETRQKMTTIRRRIAERLIESQQKTATLTTFNEADLSAVMELRNKYKDLFKQKHNVGLGFMGFFVRAVVEALKAFPVVNARVEGDEIVHPGGYHIGVAVSTEKGLMVPVLRDADRLSFAQVEQAVAAMAAKARDGKITVTDLQGGTFTITNGGVFGSLLSTPILNPPQSAILGMHAIQKRPVVVNDAIVIRPMMYLALSYDHRLIDGREAVQFLVRVKECVENPERMLLAI